MILYIQVPGSSSSIQYLHLTEAALKCGYKSFFLLALFLVSCSTPQVETLHQIETHTEDRREINTAGDEIDTTTIWHHLIDSTTTITKIIRRTIYENQTTQRSNNDSLKRETSHISDSLTPELIKTVIKGFAVACIGGGLLVLGFIIFVVVLFLKATKGP